MNSAIPTNYLFPKYSQMGFSEEDILRAWKQSNGDENKLLDLLCNPKPEEPVHSPVQHKLNPFAKLITTSHNKTTDISKSPMIDLAGSFNPEQKQRQNGISVGLKNVGNTCYVNSLLQTYFMSPPFVSAILNYNPNVVVVDQVRASVLTRGDSDLKKRRIEGSIELVKNLRKLFALMLKSHKGYLDPSEVLRSVVDDTGRCVEVGEQKDITEYHLNFISRIQEAFSYQDRYDRSPKEEHKTEAKVENKGPDSWVSLFKRPRKDKGPVSEILQSKEELNPVKPLEESTVNGKSSTMIKNHFFGEMLEIRSYGIHVLEETKALFGPIILDISSNRDIYAALDRYCNVDIEDYKAPTGDKVKAEQKTWVTRAPEFLVFQLNRVSYDIRYGLAYKNNKTFEFETELYLDRFLIENREESVRVSALVNELKIKLEKNEAKLSELMNCLGSNQSAPEVLSNAEGFLSFQLNSQKNQEEEDISAFVILEQEEVSEEEVQTAMKVLRAYKTSLEHQISEITNNITLIKEEMNNLLASMNQKKYHLVSILIHAGDSGRGHYYSFSRNPTNNTWKKLNDRVVTPESYETVMQEALGGSGNTSAYCLVYLSDSIIKQEAIAVEKLPADLAEYVKIDNNLFDEQINSYNFNTNLSQAISKYRWKCEVTDRIGNRKSSMGIPYRYDSFATYLKSEPHCDKLLKWYLLDISLKETGCCDNLRTLGDSPKVGLIQEKLSLMAKPFSFKIGLTSSEKDELDKKLAQYMAIYPIMICYIFFIKSLLNGQFKDVCYAARRILFMENKEKNWNFHLVRDLSRVVCLRLALKAEFYIKTNKLKDTQETIDFLTALLKGILKQDDMHVEQCKMIINDAISQVQGTVSAEDFNLLKQEAYRMTTGMHRISELERVIKDYKGGEKLEQEIEAAMIGDTYGWKEIERGGASYELAKLVEDITKAYYSYIQFHEILLRDKLLLSLQERKASSIIVTPKPAK